MKCHVSWWISLVCKFVSPPVADIASGNSFLVLPLPIVIFVLLLFLHLLPLEKYIFKLPVECRALQITPMNL